LKALFFICQAAGRHMIPRRQGKILNVASLNSFIGGIRVATYAASKGGVTQLTKALSNEWAKYNIQVNAIAPGSIATDM
jgi:2-deoxy-D-gluconate 3-dehydrogenase